jgi:hypothetical protein
MIISAYHPPLSQLACGTLDTVCDRIYLHFAFPLILLFCTPRFRDLTLGMAQIKLPTRHVWMPMDLVTHEKCIFASWTSYHWMIAFVDVCRQTLLIWAPE